MTKTSKTSKALEVAQPTETKASVKVLTGMVSITAIANGPKSCKTVKATKPKTKGVTPSFYFTVQHKIQSVVDVKFQHFVGNNGFDCNVFGEQQEIKDAHDNVKAGKPVTAFLYADAEGNILLRLRPTKLGRRDFASMVTDDVEKLDAVSVDARKYKTSIITDKDLDDKL
jgi:hypothetical protein